MLCISIHSSGISSITDVSIRYTSCAHDNVNLCISPYICVYLCLNVFICLDIYLYVSMGVWFFAHYCTYQLRFRYLIDLLDTRHALMFLFVLSLGYLV